MAFPQQRHSSSSSSSGSSSSSNSSSSSSSSGSSSSSSDEEDEFITEETKWLLLKAKKDYRALKGKLFQAIKENEILTDELRRHQRKLLRLNRDKYFLFERLLAYEKPPPKQSSGPREERIEIVDGVPKVVKVGKKRGPKPKKKEPEPPPFMLEPGSSLLKIKSSSTMPTTSSPVRKRASKSKKHQPHLSDDNEGGSGVSDSSSLAISFSPGFSKTKAVPSLKRQQHAKQQQKALKTKAKKLATTHDHDLSNSNTQDTVLSCDSGAAKPASDFFRHDSFSHEMPDNLFDD